MIGTSRATLWPVNRKAFAVFAAMVGLILVASGLIALLVAVSRVETQVSSPDGICGSAWHFRPGHGVVTGGELTPKQREAISAGCRAAAVEPYQEGSCLAVWAVCLATLGAGALTTWATLRPRRTRAPEGVADGPVRTATNGTSAREDT